MDVISKWMMFFAGFIMVINSADWIFFRLSSDGEVVGYTILSAHWWVMLVVGILLCFVAILEQRKLSVIEAKLDLLMTKQDCHNCHHTLQYPSTFSGQIKCPKCSTIVDTHS